MDALKLVTDTAGYLSSGPVHPVYFPVGRLAALHAFKVALVWASLTRGKNRKQVGVLGDLFGYLCLACKCAHLSDRGRTHGWLMWFVGGGGTLVSVLLGTPPSWLVSPDAWLSYVGVYVLIVPTRIAAAIDASLPAKVVAVFGAIVDGFTRGNSIVAVPGMMAASGLGAGANAWATALLSGVAVSGGGWVVSTLGLHEESWALGKPAVLDGGVWSTLDLWAGMLCGLVNAALLRSHAELEPVSARIGAYLPTGSLASTYKAGALVSTETARAVCIALTAALMLLRVFAAPSKAPATVVGAKTRAKKNKTKAGRAVSETPSDVSFSAPKPESVAHQTATQPNPSAAKKRKNKAKAA